MSNQTYRKGAPFYNAFLRPNPVHWGITLRVSVIRELAKRPPMKSYVKNNVSVHNYWIAN